MPRRMLITAGPTHEPIDEVRYIANRSSGRMGIAIAEAACEAGWEVTLLLGPTPLGSPLARVEKPASRGPNDLRDKESPHEEPGHSDSRPQSPTPRGGAPVQTIRFTTTEDLRSLLAEHFPKCDVLVMAAAVADYRPVKSAGGKIERGAKRLMLELEPTPDLVAECAKRKRPHQFLVGFALEEAEKLRDRALEKLKRKGLDAIVANPLDTMGSETVDPMIMHLTASDLVSDSLDRTPKEEFARSLVHWIGEFGYAW